MYKFIKTFYEKGFYTKEDVRVFVDSRQITEEEYLVIINLTGDEMIDDILASDDSMIEL